MAGSVGTGVATAAIKASALAASDPLAQGLSTMQIMYRADSGAKALLIDDFRALGGTATSDLAKYNMMQQGVNAAGQPYPIATTWYQSAALSMTPKLLVTGPTAAGNVGVGAVGAALSGVAAWGNYSSGK